ncbi:MAG TPA: hypothetical protein VGP64_07900 [Polyangia bacterium]
MKKFLKPPKAQGGQLLQAPTTEGAGNTNAMHPTFCLRDLWNLDACETSEQAALAKKMRTLAQQTWSELHSRGCHKGGCEPIPVKQLKGVKLPPLPQGVESVLVFRFDGNKPMLGLRQGSTFRVFHLDRDFTAYDHGS